MGYPMPQLAFSGCLSIVEFLLACKVMHCTTINHSNKVGTMQADWYNH